MKRAFISYARADYRLAQFFADLLKATGHRVWLDTADLRAGDSWPDKIREAIQDSDVVLGIISERSNSSQWVAEELELALRLGRSSSAHGETKPRVVPIVMKGTHLPAFLRHIHALELEAPSAAGAETWGREGKKLLDFLLFHTSDGEPYSVEQVVDAAKSQARASALYTSALAAGVAGPTAAIVAHDWFTVSRSIPEGVEGEWARLQAQTLVLMPAGVAILVGVLLVIMLMIITWMISLEAVVTKRLDSGRRWSWVASTTIILVIANLGLYGLLLPELGLVRWITIPLSALVWFLFVVDGLPEMRRLGVLR